MRVARRRHPMPPLTRPHPAWGGGSKSASLPEPTPDKAGAHVTDTHRPKTVTRAPRGWDTTLCVEPQPVFWYDTSRVSPGEPSAPRRRGRDL